MGVIGATVVGGAYCTWPSCVVMSHLMRHIMLPKKATGLLWVLWLCCGVVLKGGGGDWGGVNRAEDACCHLSAR